MDVVHAVCNCARRCGNLADLQLARSLPESMAVRYWDDEQSAWQWAAGDRGRRTDEEISMVVGLFDLGNAPNVEAHAMLWYLAHSHHRAPPDAPPILLVPIGATDCGYRHEPYHVHVCDLKSFASSQRLAERVQKLWRSYQEGGHLKANVCVVCSETADDRLLQHLATRKGIFHRVHRTMPLPDGPHDYCLVDFTVSPSGHPPTSAELVQRIRDTIRKRTTRKHLFYWMASHRPAALPGAAEQLGWRSYAIPLGDGTTCFCLQQAGTEPRPRLKLFG